MNRDKRATVALLSDLVGAYADGEDLPHAIRIKLYNGISELARSELLSMKKMEPYKDNAGTAANFDNAEKSYEALSEAASCLTKGDLWEAGAKLLYVAEGCPDIQELKSREAKAAKKVGKTSKKGLVKRRA